MCNYNWKGSAKCHQSWSNNLYNISYIYFLDHQFVTGWSSAVHGTLYTISIAKCDTEVIINIHRNPSYHRGLICNPPHHHQRIKVLLNFSQFFNCLVICSKEEVLYLFPPLSIAPLGSRYSDFASMF